MTTRRTWLLVAVLALVGGCTDFCEGDTVADATFVRADQFGDQIALCLQHQHCEPLCADVFQIDGRVTSCVVASAQHTDLSTQAGPLPPNIELGSLRGINLRVVYVQRVACASSDGAAGWSDDGSSDDGSYDGGDDGGDDGTCDDSSCDDGGGGSGDDGGGDGGGDDGGGDDGGGDDGGGDGFTAGGSARHR